MTKWREKESKTKRRQRQKTTGTTRGGQGRQISGNATSCAMKAIKYARLFEGKATSIFRQVKRVKGNDKIQGSKGKKKGDFNAKSTIDTLRKCEKDIEEKCANAVTGNATKLAG